MSDIPKVVETREETFGGVRVRLHYLDDGQRVIEAAGMEALAKKMADRSFPVSEALRAIRWVKGDA